ncbi:hypothetical protein [Paludibacterium purpuratum]|uniref:hypothetical protein n=1 Tax=Paludibacterium purpuratum TaxID=1144873 RepID=UPI001AACDDEB|nr:hypothetical protein [Paludibacterium purpuratum]
MGEAFIGRLTFHTEKSTDCAANGTPEVNASHCGGACANTTGPHPHSRANDCADGRANRNTQRQIPPSRYVVQLINR